jgi:pyruvyltransferase
MVYTYEKGRKINYKRNNYKKGKKMKNYIKNFIRNMMYLYYDLFYSEKNSIKMMYYEKNFGDAVNPYLINFLTGNKILRVNPKYYNKEHLLAIGSILQMANMHSLVWGTGLISEDSLPKEKPKKIYAVRGPKTRDILIKNGFDCPEVYGDPALLLPKIYNPKIQKKYKLGIVAHYVDKDSSWIKKLNDPEILIINILVDNPKEFIDNLLLCEKIASSSLHGIIVADAYQVPSIWIKFSDKIIGGDFKFLDYFFSVKRKDIHPILINNETSIEELEKYFYNYQININIDLLLESAPFKIISKEIN